MSLPLNIDWQQIILHLFNFVILFAILYYLLYKPVKDFMEKRIAYYKKLEDEAKENLALSEQAKEEYQNRLAAVDSEISEKREAARREVEESNECMIERARKEAEKIVAEAHLTMEREHDKMLRDAGREISDMVVSATEKILSGTSESFDQFLETAERGGEHE